ncbi:hypothetical protein ACIHFE_14645 [Streptomyces sp. NPDC052396]|uniref:hypothetical protein n=1 Tax=Streptomyces sp. NPDC052396 TaxID=3365689 RepID=UPI0037D81165
MSDRNPMANASLIPASKDMPWAYVITLEDSMHLGAKATLLSAAISALAISGAGSAHAVGGDSGEGRAHAGAARHFEKIRHVEGEKYDQASIPTPLAVVPLPATTCPPANIGNGGAGGTGAGGIGNATGPITTNCTININLPAGMSSTATETHGKFFARKERERGNARHDEFGESEFRGEHHEGGHYEHHED